MALPKVEHARPYYQAAMQRFEDARFLLDAHRTTGAVYLAGYCVECMLKALILSSLPKAKRIKTLDAFRGSKAHDYDWLKKLYIDAGGPQIPGVVTKAFSLVNTWAVVLRYKSGTTKYGDAKTFLEETKTIMDWADRRM